MIVVRLSVGRLQTISQANKILVLKSKIRTPFGKLFKNYWVLGEICILMLPKSEKVFHFINFHNYNLVLIEAYQ